MDEISAGDILNASAIVVSIIGGAIFAYFQVKTHRRIATDRAEQERKLAAQKATLEFISDFEVHDEEWLEVRKVFVSLRQRNELAKVARAQDQQQREKRLQVTTFLNHYELVAVAINHGIIDEDLYAEWCRSTLVGIWRSAQSFIAEFRLARNEERAGSGDNIYTQFQSLAEKWSTVD